MYEDSVFNNYCKFEIDKFIVCGEEVESKYFDQSMKEFGKPLCLVHLMKLRSETEVKKNE